MTLKKSKHFCMSPFSYLEKLHFLLLYLIGSGEDKMWIPWKCEKHHSNKLIAILPLLF